MNSRRGFSLLEMMIALVVLSFVMASTVSVLRSQSRGFQRGNDQLEMGQNIRYAAAAVDRVVRTAGAGVANEQPVFIYGGNDVVAVNANYWSRLPDGCAVNTNPDVPAGALDVLPVGSAAALPNTTYLYPSMTFLTSGRCASETIVFYLRPDSTTADVNDFALYQRVNVLPPELVARNLYAYPGRPFFEYFVHPLTAASGRDSLVIAGAAGSGVVLPIVHTVVRHGSAGDTATVAIADSVKAVRLNVRVTNGRTGTDQRYRDVSSVTTMPNNGLVQLRTCGSAPILSGTLGATPNVSGAPQVTLTWPAAADETAGETDVTQYNVYRRLQADPVFGSAVMTVPAGSPGGYTLVDGGVTAATSYVYAVTAQDCSPSQSGQLVSAAVTTAP